jgi:hypothetical protein
MAEGIDTLLYAAVETSGFTVKQSTGYLDVKSEMGRDEI